MAYKCVNSQYIDTYQHTFSNADTYKYLSLLLQQKPKTTCFNVYLVDEQ